jgi:hypothetical protein
MIELKMLLEMVALIVITVVSIFGIGRWFGWSHKEIIDQVSNLKKLLEKHINDEEITLNDIREDIKQLEKVCVNGNIKK